MAKNLLSNNSYRNLDVDAFDPEKYVDGDESTESPDFGIDEAQIKQLLQSNKNLQALKVALMNPPLKTKNQTIKDKAVTIVVRVITSFPLRNNEIEGGSNVISSLTHDELDLLMKYIYKGMELLADGQTCQQLLAWHKLVFSESGHGGILRVFCDRNRL